MHDSTNSRKCKWAAIVCLLPVVLLQAPFARAAWLSSSMACCMDDHCPVPGHHHKGAAAENDVAMNCGHNMDHMSDCWISCCKTIDETVIDLAQFVMPNPQIYLPREGTVRSVLQCAPQMIARAEEPQSPPPRVTFS